MKVIVHNKKINMKKELIEIYQQKQSEFNEIAEKFKTVNLHGPFLTSPGESYKKSKIKLLIIGQETNGWYNIQSKIEGLMNVYEEFNLGKKKSSSPFWNITRKIERILEIEEYSCAWTNLNKYDVNSKRPKGNHEKEISQFDDLLISEIEILKPDVCIFFTGPSFDYRLKKIYSDIILQEEENWKHNQLVNLKHEKLPKISIRTYHPKYLRMKKFESSFLELLKKKMNTVHNK
ncbi:MAG: hypothetical protein ACI85O_003778 [Saprospiraceae bacterium]|jgi:hypothetical protein